jgi:mono/diheme cytochrome c family protein
MSLSPARLLAVIVVSAMTVSIRSQTQPAYTAIQAAAGLAAYQTNCAACHLPDLSGRNEAPPLAGGNFMNAWGSRTTSELIRYMQGSMPPSNPGGLSDETYANIAALFCGRTAHLPATPAVVPPVRIGSVANGQSTSLRETLAKPPMRTMAPRAAAPRHHRRGR